MYPGYVLACIRDACGIMCPEYVVKNTDARGHVFRRVASITKDNCEGNP
jgi:hypothetical protein